MIEVRFLGHAGVHLSDEQTRLVIDPWLSGNPMATTGPEEIEADVIVVTPRPRRPLG